MSQMDLPTLEFFIQDAWFLEKMPAGSYEKLLAHLEPHREEIESQMEWFEQHPGEASWRDFRNTIQHYLPECPDVA